jgi:hypothetical protein
VPPTVQEHQIVSLRVVDCVLGDNEYMRSFWYVLGHPIDHLGVLERYPVSLG